MFSKHMTDSGCVEAGLHGEDGNTHINTHTHTHTQTCIQGVYLDALPILFQLRC